MNKLLIFIIAICLSPLAMAQGTMFGMSYQTALPVGTTGDFISNFSGRGFGLDYKGFVSPNVAVGGTVGWNVFYEGLDNGSYNVDEGNTTLTGQQWRYINSFPILLTVDYFMGDYGDARIFVGGGIGTYRIYQRIDMGLYSYEPREWHFGLAPHVGVAVPMNRDAYFLGSIRFNYAFESGSIEPQSYIGFNVGFAWN